MRDDAAPSQCGLTAVAERVGPVGRACGAAVTNLDDLERPKAHPGVFVNASMHFAAREHRRFVTWKVFGLEKKKGPNKDIEVVVVNAGGEPRRAELAASCWKLASPHA